MDSSSKSYADAVRGQKTNSWWRKYQAEDEEEAMLFAIQKSREIDFRLEYLNYFIQFKQSYLTINQSDFFFLSRVCVDIETSDSDECLFKPVFTSEK